MQRTISAEMAKQGLAMSSAMAQLTERLVQAITSVLQSGFVAPTDTDGTH